MSARPHLALQPALKWRLIELAAAVLGRVPQVSRLSPAFGDIARILAGPAVANVEDNLRHALPAATRRRVRHEARDVFRSVARYNCAVLSLPSTDIARLHAAIDVDGYEHFLAARSAGRGVIVAGVHHGPAEIVLQAFSARSVHYTAMVERIRPAPLAALLERIRSVNGQQYVFADLAGVKACLRTLRAGGVVAVLVDRDVVGNGVPVRFLDGQITAPVGIFSLARASHAPIVPAVAYWRPDHGIHVTFMSPILPAVGQRRRTQAAEEMTALLARFADHIRAYPGQWLVLERLFHDEA